MEPILYINYNKGKPYDDNSLIQRIRDRFKIGLREEYYIKEINTYIYNAGLPPNINTEAFSKNINIAEKIKGSTKKILAPKTYRNMDYYYFNSFQKKLLYYSIVKTIQLLLRINKKSIKNSAVLVYDAASQINRGIIYELAKSCKYLILLSNDLSKTRCLQGYVTANYGVAPVITNDFDYASKEAEFIVSSSNVNFKESRYVWYINNYFVPAANKCTYVNDVTYSAPWEYSSDITIELLGAVLSQMGEKNIEDALKYNGVFLDKIKFNENEIEQN